MRVIRFKEVNFFFLCNLWAWAKGFLDSDPFSYVNFVDWLTLFKGFFNLFCIPLVFFGVLLFMCFFSFN